MDRALEYILEVARTGSIARASQLLYITPSALSKFIQNKEKELGVVLFDRVGKRFVLTHAGEAYVRWGTDICEMQKAMEDELRNIARGKSGRISLGFPMILARTVTTHIIPQFKKAYPDIHLILEETTSVDLERKLEENIVDFAIMVVSSYSENLVYQELLDDRIVLAVHKDHPLIATAVKKEEFRYPWVDIRDFADETFIGLYPGQVLRQYTEMVLREAHIKPDMPIQVHSVDTSIRCVMNGLGVTITYDSPLWEEDYHDQIVALSFGEKPAVRKLCLVSHKDHQLSGVMKTLMKVCQDYYENVESTVHIS